MATNPFRTISGRLADIISGGPDDDTVLSWEAGESVDYACLGSSSTPAKIGRYYMPASAPTTGDIFVCTDGESGTFALAQAITWQTIGEEEAVIAQMSISVDTLSFLDGTSAIQCLLGPGSFQIQDATVMTTMSLTAANGLQIQIAGSEPGGDSARVFPDLLEAKTYYMDEEEEPSEWQRTSSITSNMWTISDTGTGLETYVTLGRIGHMGDIKLKQVSAPSTPAADFVILYIEDNGSGVSVLRMKDEAGTVTTFGAGGGGGMTNPMTTYGDLIWGGTAGEPSRLALGDETQILMVVDDGVLKPMWADAPWMVNPMTTSQDLIVGGTSGAPGRLAKGTDTYVLTMVSGSVAWAAASGSVTYPSGAFWQTRSIGTSFYASGTSFTINDTDAPYFPKGIYIRFKETGGSTWYYARVVNTSSSGGYTTVTFMGAAMTTSLDDVMETSFQSHKPEEFMFYGAYADGTSSNLISTDILFFKTWYRPAAYILGFSAKHKTDAGTTNPTLNVQVNSQDLLSSPVSADDTWVHSTTVQTSYYDIQYGEDLEAKIAAASVGTQAKDLTFIIHYCFA